MSSTLIISDVHLGSPFSMSDRFIRFLNTLDGDMPLVLNGDTVSFIPAFTGNDEKALDLLREQSLKRPVIWIRGNHDMSFDLPDPARIKITTSHVIHDTVYVTHGHDFAPKACLRQLAITTFRTLYRLYNRLAGVPIPPSTFAKKFGVIFGVYQSRIDHGASAFARAHGYLTMVLGHTHSVEDVTIDGIRLLNTGSWMEFPLMSLSVSNTSIELKEIKE